METNSKIFKANDGANAAVISNFLPPAGSTPPPVTVSSVASRPCLDPHSLSHRQLPKAVRAVLAAEVLDGRIRLLNPTLPMVADAAGVSSSYVAAARRLSPEQRQAVVRGTRPLVVRGVATPVQSVEQRLVAIVAELGGIPGLVVALSRLSR
jgi:hypothetical protein